MKSQQKSKKNAMRTSALLLPQIFNAVFIHILPFLWDDVEEVILKVSLDDNLIIAGDAGATGKALPKNPLAIFKSIPENKKNMLVIPMDKVV